MLCEVEDVLYAKLQIPIMQTLWWQDWDPRILHMMQLLWMTEIYLRFKIAKCNFKSQSLNIKRKKERKKGGIKLLWEGGGLIAPDLIP